MRALLLVLLSAFLVAAKPAATVEQGKTLVKAGKFDEARKLLEGLKLSGKDEAQRFFHLARAYAGLKKYGDAENANQRAVAIDPTLLEGHYNNACYASLAGDKNKAFHYLEVLNDSLMSKGDMSRRKKFQDLMATDPDLNNVRKDPRYAAASEKVSYGMPKALYMSSVYYKEVIQKVAGMVSDPKAVKSVQKKGLQLLNLTWEDTGRYKDSSVGPNISDMTIQVAWDDPQSDRFDVTAMPVMRFDNFTDKTADVDPRDFTLLVGNEKGQPLKRVSLYDFLKDPLQYMTKPGSWTGKKKKSLLAESRDNKALVSAQACFLPIPKEGKAEFNPVIFNYQGQAGDPAVLAILATREGTSMTIIDNQRDAFQTGSVWGQRLFHNDKGERASLTGERLADFKAGQQKEAKKTGKPVKQDVADDALNMVLLIQVPLKQKNPMQFSDAFGAGGGSKDDDYESADMAAPPPAAAMEEKSDVEAAVVGHGKVEGPYTEVDNLEIERDDKFPVRVTVQFYKATSNGVINDKDVADIREQIDKVYARGEYVGSLVTEGHTGRPTEYVGAKVQPKDWWEQFWVRYEKSHKTDRKTAMKKLAKILGKDFDDEAASDLYVRTVLLQKDDKK